MLEVHIFPLSGFPTRLNPPDSPRTPSIPIHAFSGARFHLPRTDKTTQHNINKHTMHRNLTILSKMAFCAVLALGGITTATAEDKAPSATGTWTWTTPARNGGQERKMSLALTQDGDKLSGKLTSPGRDGGPAREAEIEAGAVKDGLVTFQVTRDFNGTKVTSKYNGKLAADTITGKIESKDRDGNDQTRDWTAKKEAK